MKKGIRALLLLALLILLAMGAFRHFVTNRVTDRDGMENPDATLIEETPVK